MGDFHRPASINRATSAPLALRSWAMPTRQEWPEIVSGSVSYTHLTLPTIYSV